MIEEFKLWAKAKYPEEVCGCVCGGEFIPLENEAEDKKFNFKVSYSVIERIRDERGSDVTEILHTHTNGQIYASYADIACQIALGIPYGIVTIRPERDVEGGFLFSPVYYIGKHDTPLLDRPYIFGIYDCFTLLMDYYKTKFNIDVPNYPRKWGWEDERDLLTEKFDEAGFFEIPINDVKEGDCCLMTFRGRTRRPSHCGVYIGNDVMLHHPSGGQPVNFSWRSVEVPIIRYLPNVTKWLRRKENA